MTTVLLIVDIQNDYFPGGRMELAGSLQAGEQAARLLAAFRQLGLPTVHIQHLATRPGATFFLPGTPGAPSQARRSVESSRISTSHTADFWDELTKALQRLVESCYPEDKVATVEDDDWVPGKQKGDEYKLDLSLEGCPARPRKTDKGCPY